MRHWAYAVLACTFTMLLTVITTCFINHDVICGVFVSYAIYATSYLFPVLISSIIFDILRHSPPYITIMLVTFVHIVCYINKRKLDSRNITYKIKYFLISIVPVYIVYYIFSFISFHAIVIQLVIIILCSGIKNLIKH